MPSLRHTFHSNTLASPSDCATARQRLLQRQVLFHAALGVAVAQPVAQPLPPALLADALWVGGHVRVGWPPAFLSLHHSFHAVWPGSRREHATARASSNGANFARLLDVAAAKPVLVHPALPPGVLVGGVWVRGTTTLGGRMPSLHHTRHSVELARLRDCATIRASSKGRNLPILSAIGGGAVTLGSDVDRVSMCLFFWRRSRQCRSGRGSCLLESR